MSASTAAEQSGRRTTIIVVCGALVLLIFLALRGLGWVGGAVSPRTVEGWAMPNASGTAVSLHDSPDEEWGKGYIVAGAEWRGPDHVWHDGADTPTCVGTDTASFTHVRIGLVTVKTPHGGTRDQVSWLECLE